MPSSRPSPPAPVSAAAVPATAAPRVAGQSSSAASATLARWLPTPLVRGSALVHLAALGLVAAGRWRWAAAAVFADHVVLAAAGMTPRSRLLGPLLTRLPAEAAARGEVALTFDDGPDPRATPAVLDLLDAGGHRASFFLIGRRAEAHPELVAEIVRRGHAVENHTHRHSKGFALLGPRRAAAEIDRAQETLTTLAGSPPAWFRPPAGMRNPWTGPLAAGRGLAIASWTRRGFDAVSRDPAQVARRLTAGLAAGDVLLLHDGGGARGAGRRVVVDALPAVLAALAQRGLTSVPLPRPTAIGGADVAGGAELAGAAGVAGDSGR
jgi:peptidoglycan-N-acetylglucosamine deacetylase